MLAKVQSSALIGLDAEPIHVEVDIATGLERITVVGLPDTAVRESSERVRSAISNSGFFFPQHRLTINLAPANLRKEGPAYDLPIALGILLATRQVIADLDQTLVIGELGLEGNVRHVNGVLSMAAMAKERGYKRLFVPASDASEAALIEGLDVYPIARLRDLVQHLMGTELLQPYTGEWNFEQCERPVYPVDMRDIRGQEHIKRALEIACAGSHNLLMKGVPGSGKTLLARALPSILPELTFTESLEITRIYSVAGILDDNMPLIRLRPFRAPHHTISHAGLVGGGTWPRPGEVSLAHRGLLFLDEMAEFSSKGLEALRQPLEDRVVTISRASGTLTFPANFMLVAAMNRCPCGWYGDDRHECTCSMAMIQRYQNRISGPLMDRIDIHLDVQRVPFEKLSANENAETSETIRARVEEARKIQLDRFADGQYHGTIVNSDMGPGAVQHFCELDEAGKTLLRAAVQQMNLSARAYHRILKLARTIADLAQSEPIDTAHLAEALQYRPREIV